MAEDEIPIKSWDGIIKAVLAAVAAVGIGGNVYQGSQAPPQLVQPDCSEWVAALERTSQQWHDQYEQTRKTTTDFIEGESDRCREIVRLACMEVRQ